MNENILNLPSTEKVISTVDLAERMLVIFWESYFILYFLGLK